MGGWVFGTENFLIPWRSLSLLRDSVPLKHSIMQYACDWLTIKIFFSYLFPLLHLQQVYSLGMSIEYLLCKGYRSFHSRRHIGELFHHIFPIPVWYNLALQVYSSWWTSNSYDDILIVNSNLQVGLVVLNTEKSSLLWTPLSFLYDSYWHEHFTVNRLRYYNFVI